MSDKPKKINLKKKTPTPTAPAPLTYDQFVALIKAPANAKHLATYLAQQEEESVDAKVMSSSHATRSMFVVDVRERCGLCLSGTTLDTDEYDDGCTIFFNYGPATTDAQKQLLVKELNDASTAVNMRRRRNEFVFISFLTEQGKRVLECSEVSEHIALPSCRLSIYKNE